MLTKHEREHESPKGRWNGEDWCVECMRAERAAIREQVKVLRRVLEEYAIPALKTLADYSSGYGAFPGGDPRRFTPDPECSTPEEREAHRAACELAEKHASPGTRDLEPAHVWTQPEEARRMVVAGEAEAATIGPGAAHVAREMFGLGTYTDPEADAALDACRAALASTEPKP